MTLASVAYWAQNNPKNTVYSQTGFLGQPDWATQRLVITIRFQFRLFFMIKIFINYNTFRIAWHVSLMVGYLVAQFFGGVIWVCFSSKLFGQIFHILFETMGLIVMSLGLIAAVYDKNVSGTAHITTMHSWIGIFCIGIYSVTYLYGFVIGLIPVYFPKTNIKSITNLRSFHALLGQISLYTSIISVLTGD